MTSRKEVNLLEFELVPSITNRVSYKMRLVMKMRLDKKNNVSPTLSAMVPNNVFVGLMLLDRVNTS